MDSRSTAFLGAVDHYENFPVASWLVPAPLRPPITAIYRFARYADDVADEGDAPIAERVAELHVLAAALAGRTSHPAVDPLGPWRARYQLPAQPFLDLLSAFEQDLHVQRYATHADVLDYCRRSANPVGELVLRLFGRWDASTAPHSDAICTGLQLVNFLQDVASDHRRGRVYLPESTLAGAGCAREAVAQSVAAGRCRAELREAIRHEAGRAARLLDFGAPLAAMVPLRLGLELRAVLAGARRVLERLARGGFDPIARTACLGWPDAPAILRLWIRAAKPFEPALARHGGTT